MTEQCLLEGLARRLSQRQGRRYKLQAEVDQTEPDRLPDLLEMCRYSDWAIHCVKTSTVQALKQKEMSYRFARKMLRNMIMHPEFEPKRQNNQRRQFAWATLKAMPARARQATAVVLLLGGEKAAMFGADLMKAEREVPDVLYHYLFARRLDKMVARIAISNASSKVLMQYRHDLVAYGTKRQVGRIYRRMAAPHLLGELLPEYPEEYLWVSASLGVAPSRAVVGKILQMNAWMMEQKGVRDSVTRLGHDALLDQIAA